MPPHDRNQAAFNRPDVVAAYREMSGLTPCELGIFGDHIPAGSQVLDLGVGAGRTVPWLIDRAGRYVGIDLAPAMVAAARQDHPGIDIRVGDAADLGEHDTASFDAVVFSYNGIDYLHPDGVRRRGLAEVHRVLRPGGSFVFSTHNPRAFVADVQAIGGRPARRHAVALAMTAARGVRRAGSRASWRGEGWVLDRARGGLVTHAATPARVIAELEANGFEHADTRPGNLPRPAGTWRTPWYYYAFTAS